MLDIQDFIKERGGDPEKIRESQRKRHANVDLIDEVIAQFEDHKKTQYEATQIASKINEIQKKIGQKKKAKENADDLLKEKDELTKKRKAQEDLAAEKLDNLQKKVKLVGNYVHPSVPVSGTEDDNALIREWSPEKGKLAGDKLMSHHEVLYRIGGYDPDAGVKIVGHRGYCLIGVGFWLSQALIQYAMRFLHKRSYVPNQTPFMMNKDDMAKTAQLEQFDEELYKVVEDPKDPKSDKYLIATSEQPLSAINANEWLLPAQLPIKYAGFSTCFRKEAGSHGKDAWGLFRVHQFEKVEQFVLTDPSKSWEMFDEMIKVSEEFYQSLEIPYQVVAIVSGALNNAAAKKYDLEAWFPFQREYKELVSCSNCTDYQTREMETRFGTKKQTSTRKEYVHALNSTLSAIQRALCCVLENYQTEEGVVVPKVLRRFMPDEEEFIPYVRELPKDSTSLKATDKKSIDAAKKKMENLKV